MRARLAAVVSASIFGSFAVASAAAPSTDLVASVGCRDGVQNGAYELRMADGRPRIVGAFAKGRRTGTFLFWTAAGARIAVVPYDDDAKAGTVAVWYPPPAPQAEPGRKLEAAYAAGVRHGVTRSWHLNGRQATEYLYERGSLKVAQAWSAGGVSLPESEARRVAERDAAADADFLSGLERTIAAHTRRCD